VKIFFLKLNLKTIKLLNIGSNKKKKKIPPKKKKNYCFRANKKATEFFCYKMYLSRLEAIKKMTTITATIFLCSNS
jgi:hypothetical protein